MGLFYASNGKKPIVKIEQKQLKKSTTVCVTVTVTNSGNGSSASATSCAATYDQASQQAATKALQMIEAMDASVN
ncbi:hypothetical protein MUU74_12400 [Chryseobacterium daecheongense]|uniref:hypothetical protein n=1 Tax=Chryseobacterium daecheongense TaxID=192389 RepID=UPI001FD68F56|nr:hypothetical protein [Chryseobacterium daecheongense]UOU97288.1 hypothetical protein MUU74_12400 [Chryseobacterium daecheongense]